MPVTANKAIWVVSEGANYATDPTTGYLPIPAESVGELDKKVTPLTSAYQTNRGLPTANIPGPMAWSFQFSIPVEGLSVSAGDGSSPPADDYHDVIMNHIFGNDEDLDGEGIATVTSATAVTLDADTRGPQQLIPFYEAGVPAVTRTQWQLVTADGGSNDYTLAPGLANFGSDPLTDAGIAYGCRAWYQTRAGQGGNSLCFVYIDDATEYTLLGGRVTACTIEGEVGQKGVINLTVEGDRWATSSRALVASDGPAVTPAVMTISPVYFNGSAVSTSRVSIDLGITASATKSTAALHGRAGFINIGLAPTVEIHPLRDDNTYSALQAVQQQGRLLVQFGGGILANGALGTCAYHCEVAQVEEQAPEDDEGRARQSLKLKVIDGGIFSAGVPARYHQWARA